MGLPCHGEVAPTKPYTICRVDAAPRPPPSSRLRHKLASRKRGAGALRAYANRALDRLHTHACLILRLGCRPSTGRRAAHPRLTRRRPTYPHPPSQPAPPPAQQTPSSADDAAMTPSAPPQPRAPPSHGGFSSNRAQRSGDATPGGDSLCTPHTVHLSLGPGAWAECGSSDCGGDGGGGGGNCGGSGGGGGGGGGSGGVVADKDTRARFLFREIRGFHELAFSIVILGGVEAEEDLARAVQSAAGAWVDARPDLEACGRALASGDEDSWRNFYTLCMRDLPTYYDSLPADILREIRVRLRARYLSANVASYALHLLLAISLPNLSAHPVSSCGDVVDIVLGVLREPTSHDHARILIPALLFMCRIVSLEPACTEAVESGVVQCMLANLQHTIDSKSLYRFLLVSFVLAKVSRQDAHVDAVLASKKPSFGDLLSMLSNLPAPLGQQQDWTELAQVSLLTALQPCAARWTGVVSLHAFFSVWVLLCKHPKDTRLGKVSRAMCNELTKGCGVKVAAEHMTRRQWELLLSCEGGLLEIESVRRMARRAQDVVAARGEADQWALTRDMVAEFGWRAAHGAKSDAVRAAALQCYGELLRCLTRVEVDCELVATLLPSLRSEAERLGDAVIEPCVFISTCLLTEGRYDRAASMTIEVRRGVYCALHLFPFWSLASALQHAIFPHRYWKRSGARTNTTSTTSLVQRR